jgi:hypothetical protein
LFQTLVAGNTGQFGAAGSGLASTELGSATMTSRARATNDRQRIDQIVGVAPVLPQ